MRLLVWVNGEARDPATAHVSALDRGFTLGDGVFETMRAYDGHVALLEEHLARLVRGTLTLGFTAPDLLHASVQEAAHQAAAAGLGNAIVRLTVTRGVGAPGLRPPPDAVPTTVLVIAPLPLMPDDYAAAGIRARILAASDAGRAAGIKALGYVEHVLALREAQDRGADDALLMDAAGHVREATASNVFVVTADDTVVTPALGHGTLPGVTRAAVMRLCAQLEIDAVERTVTVYDLGAATEIFLTSSVRELVPVVLLDDTPVGDGRPGAIGRRLRAAYRELVTSPRKHDSLELQLPQSRDAVS